MHAWPSRLHAPLRLGRGPRRSTRAVRHWEKWAVGRGPLAAVAAVAAQLTNANCKGWRRHPPPRPCRAPSSPPLTRHALSGGRAITRRGDHPAPRPSVARPPDHSPATPCRVPRCGVAPVQTSAARHRQQPAPSWLGVRAAAGAMRCGHEYSRGRVHDAGWPLVKQAAVWFWPALRGRSNGTRTRDGAPRFWRRCTTDWRACRVSARDLRWAGATRAGSRSPLSSNVAGVARPKSPRRALERGFRTALRDPCRATTTGGLN